MPELERLAAGHLDGVLDFERENRSYFATSLTDRGDEFYKALPEHHQAMLDDQAAGLCVYFVLSTATDRSSVASISTTSMAALHGLVTASPNALPDAESRPKL